MPTNTSTSTLRPLLNPVVYRLAKATVAPAETPVPRLEGVVTCNSQVLVGASGSSFAQDCSGVSSSSALTYSIQAGQVGDASTTNRPVPTDVNGLDSGVSSIALGVDHSCAVKTDGKVLCWGLNSTGQLGDLTTTNRSSPVEVNLSVFATKVFAAGASSCAATSTSALYCWGRHANSHLGLTAQNLPAALPPTATAITAGLSDFSLGFGHSCAIVDGTVRCMGQATKVNNLMTDAIGFGRINTALGVENITLPRAIFSLIVP